MKIMFKKSNHYAYKCYLSDNSVSLTSFSRIPSVTYWMLDRVKPNEYAIKIAKRFIDG